MDSNVSAWTLGASVFTFAPLYLLFIAVAVTLWVLYTKPSLIPGRRPNGHERSVIFTPQPGKPTTPETPDKAGE
jgi:hypothetical protein